MTNNETIAHFMDLQVSDFGKVRGEEMYLIDGTITNAKYDFSWDWIMPVVKRFALMHPVDDQKGWFLQKKLCSGITNFDIKAVNETVLELIEWYKQKNHE